MKRTSAHRDAPGKFGRRRFLGGAAAAAGAAALLPHLAGATSDTLRTGSRTRSVAAGQRYNILLITTDQESFAYPTVPGFELPNRQRIAERGVSFQRHYTASNMCTAARSVLFTGQHVQRTGMFDNSNYPYTPDFPAGTKTLGHALGDLGYRVGYKGKWHISKAVLRTGEVNHSRSLEPFGFSDWESHGDRVGLMLEGYYQDDAIAAGAVGWLRQHGAAANRDGTPWFLTVSFINPHDIQWADVDPEDENIQNSPSVAPRLRKPPSTGLYTRRWETPPPVGFGQPLNAPGRPAAHAEFVAAWADLVGAIPGDRADMWRTHNDFYLNLLRDNDRSVGAVLNGLEELGMADNTIVVFTSDHGEHAGAHGGLRNKGPGAYDGHIHVPLLVAHPEGPRGTACDALTSSVDMMPTLFALAGGSGEQLEELCGELSGKSFAGLVGAPSRDADSFRQEGLLYCYDGLLVVDRAFVGKATAAVLAGKPDSELRPDFSKRGLQRTFFDGRYKFSRYFAPDRFNTPTSLEALIRDNDIELFDCQQDPDEMTNLAFGPARDNELIMRLNGRLNTLLAKEVGPDDGGAVSESIAHWGRWPIASG